MYISTKVLNTNTMSALYAKFIFVIFEGYL